MIHFAVSLATVLFFIAAIIHPQRLRTDAYSAFIFYVFGLGSYALGQAIVASNFSISALISAAVWVFLSISIVVLIRELIENRI